MNDDLDRVVKLGIQLKYAVIHPQLQPQDPDRMQVHIPEEAASGGGILIRMRSSILETKNGGLFWGGGWLQLF